MFSEVVVEPIVFSSFTSLQHPLRLLDNLESHRMFMTTSMPLIIMRIKVNNLTLGFGANAYGKLALWPGTTSAPFPLTIRPSTTNQEVALSAPPAWTYSSRVTLADASSDARCVSRTKTQANELESLIPKPKRANRNSTLKLGNNTLWHSSMRLGLLWQLFSNTVNVHLSYVFFAHVGNQLNLVTAAF